MGSHRDTLNSSWASLKPYSPRGSLPDVASMSKDDLTALIKQLYERSCAVFGEKFDEEFQVKKRDMEIHNLEMETSESHGTFKIPKLKKVNKFKPLGDEEESK